MAKLNTKNKGLTLLHRFCTIEEQLNIFKQINAPEYVGLSIGIKQEDYDNLNIIYNAGIRILCIDIAHAHTKDCIKMTNYISSKYPDILLIVGNVATYEASRELFQVGADVVKVGIGSGSICSTRVETGNRSSTIISNYGLFN